MKSFVLVVLLVFCASEKIQAQNGWQLGIGSAIVRFSDTSEGFEQKRYLLQIPRLNVTKTINQRLSVNGAVSFNSIEINEITTNEVGYFSIDSFLRYSLIKNSHFFDSYVFVGASLVNFEIKFRPAVNFGFGNTFWVFKNLGLNVQAMYKLSEKKNSHFQFTTGLVYNLDSGRRNLWDVKR